MTPRILVLLVGTIILAMVSASPAFAQSPTPPPPPASTPVPAPTPTPLVLSSTIFAWAFEPGGVAQNWTTGLVYLLLGIVGSLTTVYLFLGEFLPSMGGKVDYELLNEELKDFKVRRDRSLTAREKYARAENDPIKEKDRLEVEDRLSDDYDRAIERLEKQLAQERWRLFAIGFPIYILLGGFFAAAFATNLLQAVLIGFSWTAIADRIGLQRELAIKKEIKDADIGRLAEEAAKQSENAQRELKAKQAALDALEKDRAGLLRSAEEVRAQANSARQELGTKQVELDILKRTLANFVQATTISSGGGGESDRG